MNIDELKLVLDAVATVSGDAKTVAIWYFVAAYGVELLKVLAAGITVVVVARMLIVFLFGMNDWANFGRDCAKAWGGEGDTYSYRRDRKVISAILKAAPERRKE